MALDEEQINELRADREARIQYQNEELDFRKEQAEKDRYAENVRANWNRFAQISGVFIGTAIAFSGVYLSVTHSNGNNSPGITEYSISIIKLNTSHDTAILLDSKLVIVGR